MASSSSLFRPRLSARHVLIENAYVSAPHFDAAAGTYVGAVYDALGALVPESLRPSHFVDFQPVDPVSIKTTDMAPGFEMDEAIYGGHFFYAWGHFILETLSTAVEALQLPRVPVLMLPWGLTYEN